MTDISKLSESEQAVILARRAYFRKWREKNREKARGYLQRYWEKKAQEENCIAKK